MVKTAAAARDQELTHVQEIASAVFPEDVAGHRFFGPAEDEATKKRERRAKRAKPSNISADTDNEDAANKKKQTNLSGADCCRIISQNYNKKKSSTASGTSSDDEDIPISHRTHKTSAYDARDKILNKLQLYYDNPSTELGAAKQCLSGHKAFHKEVLGEPKWGEGISEYKWGEKTAYVYCGSCIEMKLHPDKFNVVIIAVLKLEGLRFNDDGSQSALVKVESMYPHGCECTKQKLQREYWRNVDPSTGGRGYDLIPSCTFFQDEIVRGTFSRIEDKLRKTGRDDPHPGTKINNVTKGPDEYPYDKRFYFKLLEPTAEQETFFHLDSQFREDLKNMHHRLTLFVANHYDIVEEFYGCLKHHKTTTTKPSLSSPCDGVPKHLYLFVPAIIYGGHSDLLHEVVTEDGQTLFEVVQQILHFDIGDTKDADGNCYSVNDNPELLMLFKAGTIIFNLFKDATTGINICEHSAKIVKKQIAYDNLLFFQGDKSHSGETTDSRKEEDFTWRPRYHVYLMSKLHPRDVENFDIDTEGVSKCQPVHLQRCHVDHQLSALIPLLNNVVEMMKNPTVGRTPSKKITALMQKTRDELSVHLENLDKK